MVPWTWDQSFTCWDSSLVGASITPMGPSPAFNWGWKENKTIVINRACHATLVAITGTANLVPNRQLIWRLGTRRFHPQVSDPQTCCKDFITWLGTRLVAPVMIVRRHTPYTQTMSCSQSHIQESPWFCKKVQSSAVITRSNLSRYYTGHCDNSSNRWSSY